MPKYSDQIVDDSGYRLPVAGASVYLLNADGTLAAEERLRRVLRNDPGMGVIRHADAGYDIAKDTARKHRLNIEDRLK